MRIPGPAIILLSLVVACTESTTAPPEPETAGLERSSASTSHVEYGSQEAPPELPSEYQVPTTIHSLEPDVGWADGRAWAGTIMRYTATNAEAVATLYSKSGAHPASRSTDYQVLPAYNELQTEPVSVLMPQCDAPLQVASFGRVWNELFHSGNFMKWGDKSLTAFKSFPCASTITVTTRDPGGAGGDRTACYNVYIDHYWWYPATGRVEYRYTDVERVCENAE
jgi:hypothetical protein